MGDRRRDGHPRLNLTGTRRGEVGRAARPPTNRYRGRDEENDAEREDEADAMHSLAGGDHTMNAGTGAGVDSGRRLVHARAKSMESDPIEFCGDLRPGQQKQTQISLISKMNADSNYGLEGSAAAAEADWVERLSES